MGAGQNTEMGKLFFEEGIPGFGDLQFFRLVQEEDSSPFYLLQSLEDEQVSFWVVDPFFFFPGYQFTVHSQAKAALHVEDDTPVLVISIVTIRNGDVITANLKAPIIINQNNRMAKQIILSEDHYHVRQPLFQKKLVTKE